MKTLFHKKTRITVDIISTIILTLGLIDLINNNTATTAIVVTSVILLNVLYHGKYSSLYREQVLFG